MQECSCQMPAVRGRGQGGARECCKTAKAVKMPMVRGVAGAAYQNVAVKMPAVGGVPRAACEKAVRWQKLSKCVRSGACPGRRARML